MEHFRFAEDTSKLFILPEQEERKQPHATDMAIQISTQGLSPASSIDSDTRADLLWQFAGHSLEPASIDYGLVTSGYTMALKNRLVLSKLLPTGILELRRYPAAFLHDIMMFPGALAGLLGKSAECDLLARLTPAILPGYQTVVDPRSRLPLLVSTDEPSACVHGIIVFGQGRVQRKLIHEHYRRLSVRRTQTSVLIEVQVPQPRSSRLEDHGRWTLQRRLIKADIWAYDGNDGRLANQEPSTMKPWKLDEYMTGAYFE